MIRCSTFAGRAVAVFGLGASGHATVRSLIDGGAEVAAWDDSASSREAAAALAIPLVDLTAADWRRFAALVLAPGVPLTHPVPHWTVAKAAAAGVPVIGDVELFFRERKAVCPAAPVVAITGTNGKSTTTALFAHLLGQLGIEAAMGGNIGRAVLTLDPPALNRVHVLELSSFQIDLTPGLAPTVGVMLNLTPDHIDRHGTIERYAAVKERLVAASEAACVGVDDAWTRAMADRALAAGRPTYPFTCGKGAAVIPRLYAIGTTLFAHETAGGYASSTAIASLDGIGTLRGRHNVQNALSALSALRALQDRLDAQGSTLRVWRPEALQDALASYPGLPHRMEQVGQWPAGAGRVLFINDSKATNADSTEKALASWPGGIYWILGGRAKEGGIAPLAPYFPRIAKAYLIGEAAGDFAAALGEAVDHEASGTLEAATAAAARDAAAGAASTGGEAVVLLSPACASYDQFKSFEHRGAAFRTAVAALVPGAGGERRSGP